MNCIFSKWTLRFKCSRLKVLKGFNLNGLLLNDNYIIYLCTIGQLTSNKIKEFILSVESYDIHIKYYRNFELSEKMNQSDFMNYNRII